MNPCQPVRNRGIFRIYISKVTAIDSLTTLFLAGLHKEFDEIAEWVSSKMVLRDRGPQSVFETTIRAVGGLAGAHALSGHPGLKARLVEFADAIYTAFNTSSGLPKGRIDLVTHSTDYLPWMPKATTLADAGSLGLEMRYVTQVTKNSKYATAAENAERTLWHSGTHTVVS